MTKKEIWNLYSSEFDKNKKCSKCLRDSQENKTLYVSSGGKYKGGSHD